MIFFQNCQNLYLSFIPIERSSNLVYKANEGMANYVQLQLSLKTKKSCKFNISFKHFDSTFLIMLSALKVLLLSSTLLGCTLAQPTATTTATATTAKSGAKTTLMDTTMICDGAMNGKTPFPVSNGTGSYVLKLTPMTKEKLISIDIMAENKKTFEGLI